MATAGLFVRQLTAELSRPGCTDGAGAVGAVAGGGCGTPTDNEAGGCGKLLTAIGVEMLTPPPPPPFGIDNG